MQSWPVCLLFALFGCASPQEEQSPQKLEAPKWPRAYQDSGDKVVVYEPQVEGEWKDHRSLHAISAIVVTPKGTTQDAYGVMELSLIHISEPTRLLSISYAVF